MRDFTIAFWTLLALLSGTAIAILVNSANG